MTTPISKGTKLGFRFIEQKEFALLVSTETLMPGTWYFVDNVFHIAFTEKTYQTYGGSGGSGGGGGGGDGGTCMLLSGIYNDVTKTWHAFEFNEHGKADKRKETSVRVIWPSGSSIPNGEIPLLAQKVDGKMIAVPFDWCGSACAVNSSNVIRRAMTELELNGPYEKIFENRAERLFDQIFQGG